MNQWSANPPAAEDAAMNVLLLIGRLWCGASERRCQASAT
jgi:hypothetical protein